MIFATSHERAGLYCNSPDLQPGKLSWVTEGPRRERLACRSASESTAHPFSFRYYPASEFQIAPRAFSIEATLSDARDVLGLSVFSDGFLVATDDPTEMGYLEPTIVLILGKRHKLSLSAHLQRISTNTFDTTLSTVTT